MASFAVLDAFDFVPIGEETTWFSRNFERYLKAAIDSAIAEVGAGNEAPGRRDIVITAGNNVMAIVRYNIDVDDEPPIEVLRFDKLAAYM